MVERLSAEELFALSAFDLGRALHEVIAETSTCMRVKREVLQRLMVAKVDMLRLVGEDLVNAKERKIIAETELQYVRDRATMLRQTSSILQSLLRAASIV